MRFGLLGTGYWAAETQATALAAHPRADLVGVWGRDPVKAKAVADRFGATAYADVDELLEAVDAVAAALPPDVQAPLAERAARAGKHLLLDKPLALTIEAADAVVDAAAATGVASVVFFTGRFDPAIAAALTDAAQTGGWYAAQATMLGSIYYEGSPYADSAWRKVHGGLWDIGPHALSRLLPVFGEVTSVSAVAGARATTHVLVTHACGAVSQMTLTLDAPPGTGSFTTVFHGDKGAVELPGGSVTAVEAFGVAIDELLAQVATGPGHPCDVRFAAQVVRVLAAAEESARTGSAVPLTR
ncbi:MAG: Gfo/Idh/MocA family oxidoreductase [Hamadaea sp.]|nr:Gfo/Idh/MocA family oxidoreductase [Hamadaea sp.]